jgi:hypothetical protein
LVHLTTYVHAYHIADLNYIRQQIGENVENIDIDPCESISFKNMADQKLATKLAILTRISLIYTEKNSWRKIAK